MNVIATIEDLLEVAAGMTRNPEPKIKLDKEDITIMHSIARQVFKGTALTDRQFALMQEKLSKYKDQFEESCDFDSVVVELRKPLREIDRSKYIKIADYPEDTPYHLEDAGKFIEVRFPFRKTDIMLINEISNQEGYYHSKGSHKHFFTYTEQNVLDVLDRFLKKDFTIDDKILEMYNVLTDIRSNPTSYLSGISDDKLININPNLNKIINDELGDLTKDTLVHFIDRKFRYGLDYCKPTQVVTLVDAIANRADSYYLSKPSKETTNDILGALWTLNRFPMLVLLDPARAEDQLYEFANYYRDILSPEEQSVLFRLDGADTGFNQLIKDRKLNNWVDKNTKIVYISKDKLPKVIVNNQWKPTVTFSYDSKIDKFVDSYVAFNCDLIVYREETVSPFRKYSKFYG
jgi:hypothetical protein